MAFELEPPEDDGLYIPEVNPWSADKHHFLRRYIDIFTTGMKNKGWTGLHYIDLFAGAGIERIKGGGLDWGSPLIAAQAPNRFTCLHLCERDKRRYRALKERLARFDQPNPPQTLNRDANDAVRAVAAAVLPGTLSLTFIDPTGLHFWFQSLKVISNLRTDFVIFFPDHLDALRNWEKVYAGKADSNLNRVLGTDRWLRMLRKHPRNQWPEVLRRLYEDQIRTLGYSHFDYERIRKSSGQPLYVLIFCSKDERGGEFWRKIATKERGGQQRFGF